MRISLLAILLIAGLELKAQTVLPGSYLNNSYPQMLRHGLHTMDSSSQKKWFLTRYTALSTAYSFFKEGHASVVALPIGLQLNRRLNDNLYAFANATIAPAYVTFSRLFIANDFNKGRQSNGLSGQSRLGMYSSASLGLLYVNDEKTFSISGSISIERSTYPQLQLPYYDAGRGNSNALTGARR